MSSAIVRPIPRRCFDANVVGHCLGRDPFDRAAEFLAEDYAQHNPNVATGRAAFVELFGQFPREPVRPLIDDLVSIVAERDLVMLAFRRELPDLENEGQTYTTTWFDLFRIADGKIVEHWDHGTKE